MWSSCELHLACLTQLLKHLLPVQSLLNDPLVRPMVRQGYEEPGYFRSIEWEHLMSQVNVGADQLLPVEVGLDWGQPFEYRTHFVGILTLRWAKFVELWVERLSFLRPALEVMTMEPSALQDSQLALATQDQAPVWQGAHDLLLGRRSPNSWTPT